MSEDFVALRSAISGEHLGIRSRGQLLDGPTQLTHVVDEVDDVLQVPHFFARFLKTVFLLLRSLWNPELLFVST